MSQSPNQVWGTDMIKSLHPRRPKGFLVHLTGSDHLKI